VSQQRLPINIAVTDQTTPAEALQMAHVCGYASFAACPDELAFVLELSERIEVRYKGHPLLRFLRIGFTAGYFRRPLPSIQRLLVASAVREHRMMTRGKLGRPRKDRGHDDARSQELTMADASRI
jgi:hypothetical protein